MGKVVTAVRLANLFDKKLGQKIREIHIEDAIVDSGASMMSLHADYISELGLDLLRTVKVNTATEITELGIYGPVEYEIRGRTATGEVMELKHPKVKALVGQIPLEQMDFLINPASNSLILNPEHDGQLILDQLIVSEDYRFEEMQ